MIFLTRLKIKLISPLPIFRVCLKINLTISYYVPDRDCAESRLLAITPLLTLLTLENCLRGKQSLTRLKIQLIFPLQYLESDILT